MREETPPSQGEKFWLMAFNEASRNAQTAYAAWQIAENERTALRQRGVKPQAHLLHRSEVARKRWQAADEALQQLALGALRRAQASEKEP